MRCGYRIMKPIYMEIKMEDKLLQDQESEDCNGSFVGEPKCPKVYDEKDTFCKECITSYADALSRGLEKTVFVMVVNFLGTMVLLAWNKVCYKDICACSEFPLDWGIGFPKSLKPGFYHCTADVESVYDAEEIVQEVLYHKVCVEKISAQEAYVRMEDQADYKGG